MAGSMSFRGRLAFRTREELALVLEAWATSDLAEASAIGRDELIVRGRSLRFDTQGAGSASSFGATVELLRKKAAPIAASGEVVATFEDGGAETTRVRAGAKFDKARALAAANARARAKREREAKEREQEKARAATVKREVRGIAALVRDTFAPPLEAAGHAFVRERRKKDFTFARPLPGGEESVLLLRRFDDNENGFVLLWYVGPPRELDAETRTYLLREVAIALDEVLGVRTYQLTLEEVLAAHRDALARTLLRCPDRDLAPAFARLREALRERLDRFGFACRCGKSYRSRHERAWCPSCRHACHDGRNACPATPLPPVPLPPPFESAP